MKKILLVLLYIKFCYFNFHQLHVIPYKLLTEVTDFLLSVRSSGGTSNTCLSAGKQAPTQAINRHYLGMEPNNFLKL